MNRFELNEFVISKKKVTQYLLNIDHPDGGSKARFFINYGFTRAKWQTFAQAICQQAASHVVKPTIETPFGTRLRVKLWQAGQVCHRWCYGNTGR
jgi:hypothetical protein